VRIVVALGGNALLLRGEKPDANIQVEHVQAAAEALAPIATDHELIICHGNGPQVGLLALESGADVTLSRPYPLDVLGAQTQGMIGYWLAQSLRNAGVTKPIVSPVTQTEVAADDPAFASPTKFVGAVYTHNEAAKLASTHGWAVAADGASWRRVVASPQPLLIIEQESINGLLRSQTIVICGGGGGVPVTADATGQLRGVEAVIDKDLTAAMLAVAINADRLVLLTDVAAVMRDFGTANAAAIPTLPLSDIAPTHLPDGSMGPKLEACRRFVAGTGRAAAIRALTDAAAVIAGTAGTQVTLNPN
jgi:carbamate kinase